MNYRILNMDEYPRLDHFRFFQGMEDPFLTVTVQVDITSWLAKNRSLNRPFYLSLLYEAANAANEVPELRRRIRDNGIIEYPYCIPSYTVALPDGTYRYCDVPTDLPFADFLPKAQAIQTEAIQADHLVEYSDDPESRLFFSSTPWFSYSSLDTPKPSAGFSVPSITWGKYYDENTIEELNGAPIVVKKVKLPVSIMVNHALADAYHIGLFFAAFEKRLNSPG